MSDRVDPDALPDRPPAIGPNGAPDGLFQKFVCHRRDGKDQPGGPKAGAWYFVLDCFNDPYARAAALAYAAACEEELPELAEDLRSVLAGWEPKPARTRVRHDPGALIEEPDEHALHVSEETDRG